MKEFIVNLIANYQEILQLGAMFLAALAGAILIGYKIARKIPGEQPDGFFKRVYNFLAKIVKKPAIGEDGEPPKDAA